MRFELSSRKSSGFISLALATSGTPASSTRVGVRSAGPHHERETVKISRNPVVPMRTKLHPLFVVAGIDQQRAAILDQFRRSLPEQFTDSRGRLADKSAGRDLHQPFSEVSTQTCWACSDYQNHHGSISCSDQFTPAAITSSSLQRKSSASGYA